MKTITIAMMCLLTGCASLTPTEKKVVSITAGILVIGAIAANNSDHGSSTPGTAGAVGPPMTCTPQPNGSCR